MKKVDEITLEELDLSVRAYSILKRKKIETLGDLRKLSYNELSKIRNMCRLPLREIVEMAKEYGIEFKVDEKKDWFYSII